MIDPWDWYFGVHNQDLNFNTRFWALQNLIKARGKKPITTGTWPGTQNISW